MDHPDHQEEWEVGVMNPKGSYQEILNDNYACSMLSYFQDLKHIFQDSTSFCTCTSITISYKLAQVLVCLEQL